MRYKDYRPTGFDCRGLGLDDRQEWIVCPCGLNRDSDILEQSNWESQLAILGDESDTVEIHRFGHWACGWFEILLVDPSRENEVSDIEARLENYPILDEEDYSAKEFEAQCEYWANCSLRERIELCRKSGVSIFASRNEEIPDGIEIDIL